MTDTVLAEVGLAVLTGVFAVMWYLLRQKDDKQQAEIKLMWQKHDDDVKELQALKLQIAQQHYVKEELDKKFDRMEETFRSGFRELGAKFETLTAALLNDKAGK